jgi:hypothetical protein
MTAVGVLGAHAGAFDDVAAFQAHDVAGEQALVALGRHFFEVFALDPHLAADLEHALGRRGLALARALWGRAGWMQSSR